MNVLNRTSALGCVATTQALTEALKNWQGEQLRRDDVTVMAFTVDVNNIKGLVPVTTF
jgi:hypothetical protein